MSKSTPKSTLKKTSGSPSAKAKASAAASPKTSSTTTKSSVSPKRVLYQNAASSNAKVSRVDDSVIGYVHGLSDPIRNRGKTLEYCTFFLQISPTDHKEGLLYSTYKRPLLAESATNHTPIKLAHVTYTEEGDKIIVNDMTNVSTPQSCEYSFQYNSTIVPKEVVPVTILDVLNSFNEWDMVSVRAKVISVKEARLVGSPRKRWRLLETVIADETGTIAFDVWENLIDEIQEGQVYSFNKVQVRVWSKKKKLSSTVRTLIQPFHLDSLAEIPTASASTSASCEETLEVEEIVSVQRVDKYLKCNHCNKNIVQGTCTDIITCDRCGFMMRSTSCQKSTSVKVVILQNDEELILKIDGDILIQMFGSTDELDDQLLAGKLLSLQKFSLTYNVDTLIVSNVHL